MVESENKLSSYWWWFDSHNNSITKKSPWLQSTLAELDEKTETMLKLIEEDADSFAKRAEMYYKKRPELITILEDFYRSYRALALQYARAAKFDPDTRDLSQHQTSDVDKCYDTFSESFGFDHDQDDESDVVDDHQESSSESVDEEIMSLREEIERLKEENEVQKEMLVEKDEEKREVIRQLSFSVDLLKQENLDLKKRSINKSC
ncbi:protein NETWORKED 3A-like [Rutidosis leptorrhynchoides]|uniref:protein NETWORKED 3A-like n=1 Tax=Rutidosis leptorrhynchoides TaxID=125765 RepID=UPI003A99DA50